jgi:MSHA pilin protein MshC
MRVNGFTLIELIMVLVLVGALSIFIAPRLNTTGFDTQSFQQELKTAIRYAQKTSIASECDVQVALTATTYTLYFPNVTCNPVGAVVPVKHLAKSGDYTGTAPSGVTISGLGSFYFTANGSPSSSGTITINPGGKTITVNALTGFVQ